MSHNFLHAPLPALTKELCFGSRDCEKPASKSTLKSIDWNLTYCIDYGVYHEKYSNEIKELLEVQYFIDIMSDFFK